MGSLWSSTLLMTVSRLPWMNCAAANSPTKTYWTRRSGWDWGRTSHGESDDSLANADGPARRAHRLRAGLSSIYGLVWAVGILLRIRKSKDGRLRTKRSLMPEVTKAGAGRRVVLCRGHE